MLFHEFLQQVLFLGLVAGGFPLPLHLLVVHHLLHHAPGLAVQVAEFRVLRHDLGGVDLGRRCHYVGPPVAPRCFGQRHHDFFARGVRRRVQRPRTLRRLDGVREFALQERVADMGGQLCVCVSVGLGCGDGACKRLTSMMGS